MQDVLSELWIHMEELRIHGPVVEIEGVLFESRDALHCPVSGSNSKISESENGQWKWQCIVYAAAKLLVLVYFSC